MNAQRLLQAVEKRRRGEWQLEKPWGWATAAREGPPVSACQLAGSWAHASDTLAHLPTHRHVPRFPGAPPPAAHAAAPGAAPAAPTAAPWLSSCMSVLSWGREALAAGQGRRAGTALNVWAARGKIATDLFSLGGPRQAGLCCHHPSMARGPTLGHPGATSCSERSASGSGRAIRNPRPTTPTPRLDRLPPGSPCVCAAIGGLLRALAGVRPGTLSAMPAKLLGSPGGTLALLGALEGQARLPRLEDKTPVLARVARCKSRRRC